MYDKIREALDHAGFTVTATHTYTGEMSELTGRKVEGDVLLCTPPFSIQDTGDLMTIVLILEAFVGKFNYSFPETPGGYILMVVKEDQCPF